MIPASIELDKISVWIKRHVSLARHRKVRRPAALTLFGKTQERARELQQGASEHLGPRRPSLAMLQIEARGEAEFELRDDPETVLSKTVPRG